MPAILPRPFDDDAQAERRKRILDAAERCFARSGFHRTTMQDVATEAGMSPGNLYRYFPSKDAVVAGLCERDRTMLAEDFGKLAEAENLIESFARLGRKHFVDEPRDRAMLCLEIWAEAARNAAIGAMTAEFDRDMTGRMAALFRQGQEQGSIPAHVDPELLAILVSTVANGLFVRRAVVPSFSPERDVGVVMAMIGAALEGRIDLAPRAPRSESD